MARETLRLSDYDKRPDLVATVTYAEIPHYRAGLPHRGRELKAYEVRLDGQLIGCVEQTVFSTDRHYNRIRVPGRGRIGWAWSRPTRLDKRGNPVMESGRVYGNSTRRNAVAELLGYSTGEAAPGDT